MLHAIPPFFYLLHTPSLLSRSERDGQTDHVYELSTAIPIGSGVAAGQPRCGLGRDWPQWVDATAAISSSRYVVWTIPSGGGPTSTETISGARKYRPVL